MRLGRRDKADQRVLLKFAIVVQSPCQAICRSTQISLYLVTAAMRRPKLTAAVVLLVLAALAGTMTYTGYLVVGVLADYLGTGRTIAGLLLGALFARFPWLSKGKFRVVGLLPKPLRRPLIISLLALCCIHFVAQGDHVHAAFPGVAIAFVLTFPWLRRAVFDRMVSSVFNFAGKNSPKTTDESVIDGEFREIKDDR
jgi:peptidoglycan/LPS O-acetylase OafA/YrhL